MVMLNYQNCPPWDHTNFVLDNPACIDPWLKLDSSTVHALWVWVQIQSVWFFIEPSTCTCRLNPQTLRFQDWQLCAPAYLEL